MTELTTNSDAPNDALLEGAAAIGEFVFGNRDVKTRRRTHRLLQSGALPGFKLAGRYYARPSRLRQYIVEQENRAIGATVLGDGRKAE